MISSLIIRFLLGLYQIVLYYISYIILIFIKILFIFIFINIIHKYNINIHKIIFMNMYKYNYINYINTYLQKLSESKYSNNSLIKKLFCKLFWEHSLKIVKYSVLFTNKSQQWCVFNGAYIPRSSVWPRNIRLFVTRDIEKETKDDDDDDTVDIVRRGFSRW